jgi:superfamily II helicase
VERLKKIEGKTGSWFPLSTSDITDQDGRVVFYGTHDAIGEHRDLVIKLRNAAPTMLPLLLAMNEEVEAGRDKSLTAEHRYVGLCKHCTANGRLLAARAAVDAARIAAGVEI